MVGLAVILLFVAPEYPKISMALSAAPGFISAMFWSAVSCAWRLGVAIRYWSALFMNCIRRTAALAPRNSILACAHGDAAPRSSVANPLTLSSLSLVKAVLRVQLSAN